jgi:hypothetical protein
MTRSDLIQAIAAEIDRIWPDGFSGGWGQYEWLEANYDVTLDDDSDWTGILNYEAGVSDSDDDPLFLEFAADDSRVIPFLQHLLEKYQSNSVTAPDDIPSITMRVDPDTGETIRESEGE